ncbi:beta-lactamase family protein [Flavobacterium sp. LS1R49]|uniref:Beta-lactamase family protein n=1 Tax=Flavobacterium shii TaxID=2987687 RepID=A0A9X3BWV2_9FLAO|nr:serine hydrolase domain-containing protein [Flavobacterium shii]MCV9926125.1 beta-lactamase family protein [Flavobacterium shii]
MKKLIKIKMLSIWILFTSFQIIGLNAQINKGVLKINVPVTSEISSKEIHHYKLKLEKNQFAFFRLKQQNADVIITTYDTNNNKIADFDSPNGAFGDELFTINSTKKGDYLIEIKTLEENSQKGKYELNFQKTSPKAITPNEKVDELLTRYDNINAPGVAVAVVKDGTIVYKKGFGSSNLEYNIPITPTSIFSIASVSKQFTAFSILLLEKEGKLSLDDDVRKYIPELTDFGYKITIRNLANHTSGIRDQGDLICLSGTRLDDVITNEQVFKLITNQKELNFIPGSQYEYCNSGFVLLAKIVERVSGKKFSDFTAERIFKPLKMNNSFFLDDYEKIIKNRVYSYSPIGDTFKKSILNYSIVGSTGLSTTIEDLSLWALNFEKPIVGDTIIFNKMKKQGVLNNGEKISYALGQEIKKYKGLNVIFHGGGDAGYRSYLLRIPEEKFSVVIMSNSEAFNPLDIVYKIVDYYLENKLTETTPENKSDKITISNTTLQSYIGDYEVLPGLIFSITQNADKLYLQTSDDNQKKPLQAISESEFMIGNNKISFYKTNGQQIDLLKFKVADFIYNGKKILIKPFDKTKVQLSQYTGRYYSEELNTEYTFIIKDNILTATHIRNSDITLKPFQPDTFIGSEWYFHKIEFIKNEESIITECKISGAKATIRFKKME